MEQETQPNPVENDQKQVNSEIVAAEKPLNQNDANPEENQEVEAAGEVVQNQSKETIEESNQNQQEPV